MANSRRKKSGYHATPESLGFAEQVARAMGGPMGFDSEATRELVETLHNDYFGAVLKSTEENIAGICFEAGSSRRIQAFADANDIFFDEQLDMWLESCTHLTAIAACKTLEADEYLSLIEMLLKILDQPKDAYLHEAHREEFRPFILNHVDCMELSHAYSRAMTVFVMCHELAHIQLGHTASRPTLEHEYEADYKATEYFIRIVAKGEEAGMIFVHPKLVSAPLLMLRFFDLFERRLFHRHGLRLKHESHPPIARRISALENRLSSSLSEEALYVWDGFTKAIEDITRLAPLPPVLS